MAKLIINDESDVIKLTLERYNNEQENGDIALRANGKVIARICPDKTIIFYQKSEGFVAKSNDSWVGD